MADTIILGPGEGRSYAMGRLQASFKVDAAAEGRSYALSEWWCDPGFTGVGAHLHEANDEVFYVIEGRAEILVGDTWHILERGGFARIPAGVTHDFRNSGTMRCGLLNVYVPGGFESAMPGIVAWFADHPDGA